MKNCTTLYIIFFILSVYSCTEPYALAIDENFEELFVIEATLTDSLKKQTIKVSKTVELNGPEIPSFSAAIVNITDNTGEVYNFTYNSESKLYESDRLFKAEPNKEYRLSVISGTNEFVATDELTKVSSLESLNVRAVTQQGLEGIEITANSSASQDTSPYYRYAYEDVYRATSPYWTTLLLRNDAEEGQSPYGIYWIESIEDLYPKICYPKRNNKNFILNSTIDQSSNISDDFQVKFIEKSDYSISDRYGIRVTQYASSLEGYNFYRTLNQLAESGDILSPKQPGFVEGNVTNKNNPEENVIGIFEVVSESTKTVFFSVDDFYTDVSSEEYTVPCNVQVLDSQDICSSLRIEDECIIIRMMQTNSHLLFDEKAGTGIFIMVTNICVDCSLFADTKPPSYWQD